MQFIEGVSFPMHDPRLIERLAFEDDPANAVTIQSELKRPHKLLAAVKAEISHLQRSRVAEPRRPGEPNWSAISVHNWGQYVARGQILELGDDVLPVRVSIESSNRALLIWDALLKACEDRGMQVSAERRRAKIALGEATGYLRMSEKVSPAPDRGQGTSVPKPTGVLRFFTGESGSAKFEDRKECPLELQLNDVLKWLYRSFASSLYSRMIATEKQKASAILDVQENAQRAMIERQRQRLVEAQLQEDAATTETARLEADLGLEASAWRQAENIRSYVKHILKAGNSSFSDGTSLMDWIGWAEGVAQKIDPTARRLGVSGATLPREVSNGTVLPAEGVGPATGAYLSASELAALVGCKPNQRVKMANWLNSSGWPFVVDANGLPKVVRAFHDAKLGGAKTTPVSKRATEPNRGAFNKKA